MKAIDTRQQGLVQEGASAKRTGHANPLQSILAAVTEMNGSAVLSNQRLAARTPTPAPAPTSAPTPTLEPWAPQ